MQRQLTVVAIIAALAAGCGEEETTTTKTASTPAAAASGDAPLSAYVALVNGEFRTVLDARATWEHAQGDAAVRSATASFLTAVEAMRNAIADADVPVAAKVRHARIAETLEAQETELEQLLDAKRLDTEAVDAQISQTFPIEQIVAEFYAMPGVDPAATPAPAKKSRRVRAAGCTAPGVVITITGGEGLSCKSARKIYAAHIGGGGAPKGWDCAVRACTKVGADGSVIDFTWEAAG